MTTLADACAPYPISAELCAAFPRLAVVPAPGNRGIAVRDMDLRGPFGMPPEESARVYAIARAMAPRRALEIGVGAGWSTAHLAAALPPGAALDAVDPFTEGGDADDATVLGHPSGAREQAVRTCIRRARLARVVQLHVAASPRILPEIAPVGGWDLALIDGWHLDGQPLRDVRGVLPHLSGRGTLLLHDAYLPDVADALRWLTGQGFAIIDLATPLGLTLALPGWRKEGL